MHMLLSNTSDMPLLQEIPMDAVGRMVLVHCAKDAFHIAYSFKPEDFIFNQ